MLTAREIETAKPGRHRDEGTPLLSLHVAPGGSKSWILRYRDVDGRNVNRGIGSVRLVPAKEARRLAKTKDAELRGVRLLRGAMERREVFVAQDWPDDADPNEQNSEVTSELPTVAQAARIVRDTKVDAGELRSEKHAVNWLQVLEKHVLPTLGAMPVDAVKKRDVRETFRPIWASLPDTASRAMSRLRDVFSWAIANDYREDNPVDRAVLVAALGRPRPQVQHFAALDCADVPAAYRSIAAATGMPEVSLCLRWTILTACRSNEARGMTWGELSNDWQTWTMPAERTKMAREHRVPVSNEARAVLTEAWALSGTRSLVFPNAMSGSQLSNAAMMNVMHRLDLAATVHGFRATCRMFLAELPNASYEAAELCLAHRVAGDTVRAYLRKDYYEERVPLMASWANYVCDRS